MQKVERISGTGLPLLADDIDTDRIIPARFLRSVTFEGLEKHVFEDDRKQEQGHPFDDPRFAGARILIAGRNFGCGSSREHAPQALRRFGINTIVAESFAEIFFGNSTGLGMPCVSAARDDLKRLADAVERDPKLTVTVDLPANQVAYGSVRFPCSMPAGARTALVTGEFDFLGQLLSAEAAIRETAGTLPYMTNFA